MADRVTILIVGHGSWKPGDGYTKVPAGCTITFYTEFGKTMHGNEADEIVAGRLDRAPARVVDEFKMVPNMHYYPDSDENLKDFRKLRRRHRKGAGLVYTTRAGGRDLAGLFAGIQRRNQRNVDFHWVACQAVEFARYTYNDEEHVGNVVTGYNLTETTDGFYDYDYVNNEYVLIFQKA